MKNAKLIILNLLCFVLLPLIIFAGGEINRTQEYRVFSIDSYIYVNKYFKSTLADNNRLQQVAEYNDIICRFDTALAISCRVVIVDNDSISRVEYGINNEAIRFSRGKEANAILLLKHGALSEGETYFIRFSYQSNARQQIVEVNYDPYNASVLQLVRRNTSGVVLEQRSLRKQKL